ncbi:MAG: hypothetical protein JXR52_09150 [Bacteroidales bacterium]|nr:hypothetical protein [Bacteroidales bacterium]
MRKFLANRYNAYQNVVGVLNNFRTSYEEVPILVQYSDEFLNLFEEMKTKITKAGMTYREVSGKKAEAKAKMAQVASALAAAGLVYAVDSDNAKLQSYLRFSSSRIRYRKDADAIEICRNIYEELDRHKEALAGYMINEEQITELKNLIAEFEKLQVENETASSGNVVETRRLESLFKQINLLLKKKLDRLVKNRQLTDPEFYNQYFEARKIRDF